MEWKSFPGILVAERHMNSILWIAVRMRWSTWSLNSANTSMKHIIVTSFEWLILKEIYHILRLTHFFLHQHLNFLMEGSNVSALLIQNFEATLYHHWIAGHIYFIKMPFKNTSIFSPLNNGMETLEDCIRVPVSSESICLHWYKNKADPILTGFN